MGQLLLVALGPLSRVGDPGEGTAGLGGVALLAPDSVGYLETARTWSGLADAPWTRWGYLVVLRVGHLLGDAPTFAVAAQVLATAAAGLLLLRLGRRLAGPVAGTASAAALLLNPMTAQWTRFVLTESLFYALAVAAVTIAATDVANGRADGRVVGARRLIGVAAASLLLRPTGPLLAGAALTLAVRGAQWSPTRRAATIVGVTIATATILVLGAAATGPPAEGTFAQQLRDGVVVEGTPEVRTTITMPDAGPDDGIVAYATQHPVAVLRLGVTRVVVEVAQVRRHYPPAVNVALGAAMLTLLGLSAAGLRDRRGAPLQLPTALVLLPLVGITAVTFAVPEARYGWAGLVALLPSVGIGAQVVLERVAPQIVGVAR